MPKSNRVCCACNKNYYFCNQCPSNLHKESFYNAFCSERCAQIFKTLTDETFKKITTFECKERLIELGIGSDIYFKDSIQKHIDRVMSCDISNDNDVLVAEKSEINNVSENTVEVKKTIKKKDTAKKMKYVSKNNKNKNSEVDLNSK